MSHYNIVEGTTSEITFQLLEDGSPINLSNITVELLLADRTGTAIANPGTVTVIDAANGKVQLTPAGASVFDSGSGPYHARWKLTAVSGKISYVPSGPRDIWMIQGQ